MAENLRQGNWRFGSGNKKRVAAGNDGKIFRTKNFRPYLVDDEIALAKAISFLVLMLVNRQKRFA